MRSSSPDIRGAFRGYEYSQPRNRRRLRQALDQLYSTRCLWARASMPAGDTLSRKSHDRHRRLEIILLEKSSVSSHMYTNGSGLAQLDQLRNNAAECIRLAEAARTSGHRSFFIEMAVRSPSTPRRRKQDRELVKV